MARFVILMRKTNKEISVNPEFVSAYELSELKGCCVIRFSDGSQIEIRGSIEEVAKLLA